jgi:hypothetical protein
MTRRGSLRFGSFAVSDSPDPPIPVPKLLAGFDFAQGRDLNVRYFT